jgi:hypothetical protein
MVALGVAVVVAFGLVDAVAVCVAVAIAVADAVAVAVEVTVAVAVSVGVAVADGVGAGDPLAEPLSLTLAEALPAVASLLIAMVAEKCFPALTGANSTVTVDFPCG